MTISLHSLTSFFFHFSRSNEEADFRKATHSYENTVGVNCRHTTHQTNRETKGQTFLVIDMQLCRLSITWYRIDCSKKNADFQFYLRVCRFGFHRFRADSSKLRLAEKLKLFLSSSVFMGSFSSYELFIIPRLDGVIHNSRFSNSKYSLFIFI